MKMCGLAEVLNQILIHIYDPMRQTTASELYDCIQEQAKNLSDWWDDLPDYLKLVATDLPSYCPPSHIMILKYGLFPVSMMSSCVLITLPAVCTIPLTSYYTVQFCVPGNYSKQDGSITTRAI
jgi:hypothetical protein